MIWQSTSMASNRFWWAIRVHSKTLSSIYDFSSLDPVRVRAVRGDFVSHACQVCDDGGLIIVYQNVLRYVSCDSDELPSSPRCPHTATYVFSHLAAMQSRFRLPPLQIRKLESDILTFEQMFPGLIGRAEVDRISRPFSGLVSDGGLSREFRALNSPNPPVALHVVPNTPVYSRGNVRRRLRRRISNGNRNSTC